MNIALYYNRSAKQCGGHLNTGFFQKGLKVCKQSCKIQIFHTSGTPSEVYKTDIHMTTCNKTRQKNNILIEYKKNITQLHHG